ncbi:unnamed protein product [Vitrella brassicaformis CCMP3155]|uniref:Uncharacterized protein n=1 Tax=Vitrella brassicaformis (strain CCMP3155) TaxID=1169540 RepID=A0A0G4GP59_VITBC|nr:unnamed protein product [Vitrella brassicaformis CCMP3155]|eukprot:CEM32062.1 unnamed protein product [Vitrella brassicaformis CCMP3155]
MVARFVYASRGASRSSPKARRTNEACVYCTLRRIRVRHRDRPPSVLFPVFATVCLPSAACCSRRRQLWPFLDGLRVCRCATVLLMNVMTDRPSFPHV